MRGPPSGECPYPRNNMKVIQMLRTLALVAATVLGTALAANADGSSVEDPLEPVAAQEQPQIDYAGIRPATRPADFDRTVRLASLPTPPKTLRGASDFMCLAVTIYHEARGESLEGQQAVATVIFNRMRTIRRWGETVCEVTAPVQFSYLNKDLSFEPIREMDAWERALEVATVAMIEGPDPFLMNADHYHTDDVDPSWNSAMVVVDQIGKHIFYRDPTSRRDG